MKQAEELIALLQSEGISTSDITIGMDDANAITLSSEGSFWRLRVREISRDTIYYDHLFSNFEEGAKVLLQIKRTGSLPNE